MSVMTEVRYERDYTPKQAAASVALEAVLFTLHNMDFQFPNDTPTYKANVKKQLKKLAEQIGDKHHFEFHFQD